MDGEKVMEYRLYQRVWSVTITKHHPLLVLFIYVIISSYLTRLLSTNPQVVQLHISSHDWICNTISRAPQTLTCNPEMTNQKWQTSSIFKYLYIINQLKGQSQFPKQQESYLYEQSSEREREREWRGCRTFFPTHFRQEFMPNIVSLDFCPFCSLSSSFLRSRIIAGRQELFKLFLRDIVTHVMTFLPRSWSQKFEKICHTRAGWRVKLFMFWAW